MWCRKERCCLLLSLLLYSEKPFRNTDRARNFVATSLPDIFLFFSPLQFPPPRPPPVCGGTVSPFVHLFKAAPPLLFFSVRPSPVLLLPSPPSPCSCCSLDCAIWGNGGGGGSLSGLGNPLPPFDFPQEKNEDEKVEQ